MAAAKYNKLALPLSKVKGREILARRIGCKGVGFSLVRFKPGQGAEFVHRHKSQEEIYMALQGKGSVVLDGRRHSMPEGTILRVSPKVERAIGNDSNRDVVFLIVSGVPPKAFPAGTRGLFGDGVPNRKKLVKWRRK